MDWKGLIQRDGIEVGTEGEENLYFDDDPENEEAGDLSELGLLLDYTLFALLTGSPKHQEKILPHSSSH
jgi:hypothetical protein